jgi:L-2-hydroxycarboxylate dehydrogenase (NAD+)
MDGQIWIAIVFSELESEGKMPNTLIFRAEDLKQFMIRYFVKLNVPPQDAEIAADVLLEADLRGVDSHGIIRLYTYYGNRLQRGVMNPKTPYKAVIDTPTTMNIDGGNGLGQVVSHYAMQQCIEKAKNSGLAMIAVHNSNHFGIAGYYAMMALPHDMIGLCFTNSQPLVAPTYGRTSILGTNPIAVAVPTRNERPYVLDMATSIVPIGRITVYDKAGKSIPEGWGINQHGQVTTSPQEVLKGGSLMPLGGSDLLRGYKGYGLSMFVDILSGVLSGAAFLTHVGHPGGDKTNADVGHFFAAIRIDAFQPVEEFKTRMDQMIHELKEAPKAVGHERIYIAGEKEFERAERTRRDGVPLLANVAEGLQQSAEEIGVSFITPIGEGQTEE